MEKRGKREGVTTRRRGVDGGGGCRIVKRE
jgi:hypothetical protein